MLPVIGIPLQGRCHGRAGRCWPPCRCPAASPWPPWLNGAKNAAVLAAQMLAIHDGRIAGLLKQARADMEKDIAAKDEKLQAEIAAL